jgi:hypothetical protein
MARRAISDPTSGVVRQVEDESPSMHWFVGECHKVGIPPHILAAIFNNESRWQCFSNYGPLVAWNSPTFVRLMLRRYKIRVAAPFAAPYSAGLSGNAREQKRVWDSIALARNVYGDKGYEVALLSVAFGLGQVLGENHAAAGCATVFQLFELMWTSKGQATAAIKFSAQRVITLAMQEANFTNLASLYAGSAWKSFYPSWPADIERFSKFYHNLFKPLSR